MSINHNRAVAYRPEIDGLRAVAILPVILFHAGFELFSGGYVGVDVFFVISGYLITSIILREIEQGKFSIVRFYERRARRILPALFFVIACCLPFAWMWMLPDELKRFGQSMVSVATFSSNIYFWRKTDYFDPAAEEQPLLHTWSLAVEEQFYVLFPLFLVLCWRFGKSKVFWITALTAVLSLGLAEWGWRNQPLANFYLLPTRAWELLAGSLLAFLPPADVKRIATRSLANISSLSGLGLICYAIFAFDTETPFPSVYALAPVLGTVLIIAFANSNNLVGKLLSTKAFIGLGLISYSAYLWHQPIFAFLRIKSLGHPPEIYFTIGAVFSLALAYMTWRFVEQPTRNIRVPQTLILKLASIGLAVNLGLGITAHLANGFENRFTLLDKNVLTTFTRAKANCFDKSSLFEKPEICAIEDDRVTTTADYLVLGDSHMYSMLPAFRKLERQTDLSMRGAYVGYSGCPPLLGVHALRADQQQKNCFKLNKYLLDNAKKIGVKKVFLLARWTYYTDGGYLGNDFSFLGKSPDTQKNKADSRDAFLFGLNQTVSSWKEIGVEVVLIQQIPEQKYNPKDVYYGTAIEGDESVLRKLSVTTAEHRRLQEWVNTSFAEKSKSGFLQLVDPGSTTCLSQFCPIGNVSTSFYFDEDHLSIEGANRLSETLKTFLINKDSRS